MSCGFFKIVMQFSCLLTLGLASADQEGTAPVEEALVIDSDLADYDGKQCVLSGHVTVEHEMGTLSAKQAVMQPAAEGAKSKLGRLQILGDVAFNLKDGGRLECERADIDCQSFCGTFFGDAANAYVTYSDDLRHEGKLLVVRGRQMALSIDRDKKHADSPKGTIREITADDDVAISYTGIFIAYGGHAVYHREMTGSETPAQAVAGKVTLQCASMGSPCILKTFRGDLVKAEEIAMDTHSRQLSFSHPKGNLSMSDSDPNPVRFIADNLVWDDPNLSLTMQGHVHVSQGSMGNLDADEVHILQRAVDGRKEVSLIQTKGKAVLSYANEDKNLDYCLTCQGTIKVDHTKMEVWLSSPKSEQGKTAENAQIHLDDIKGEVFADKAFIKYEIVNGDVVPSKIILGGNVRILNTLTRHEDGTTTALQYALADQVEYTPSSNEMLFKSNAGRRVLFFDKSNNLQVSAPALKITRGSGARKETVQGYGDVRFSFIEHEFEQLRKRFAFDKSHPAVPLN